MKKLKVGTEVRWRSKGYGIAKTKRGKIVAKVPAGKTVAQFTKKFPNARPVFEGKKRSVDSYLVLVKRPDKDWLYWPRSPLTVK